MIYQPCALDALRNMSHLYLALNVAVSFDVHLLKELVIPKDVPVSSLIKEQYVRSQLNKDN